MEQSAASIALFSAAMGVISTLLCLPVGVWIAHALARRPFPGKSVAEALVMLPLVLPPVATGFVLLKLFGVDGPLGRTLTALGVQVVFTWKAVVLSMAVMSLPLVVMTVRAGFEQVDARYEQIAATLGASATRVFWTITLPLAGRSVLAGATLGFARALGEFGATIVLAGGIPGQTQTLAVAIFNLNEAGREDDAMWLLLVSAFVSFVALFLANQIQRRRAR